MGHVGGEGGSAALSGKVGIVTGGGRGLGLEIARALVTADARVVISGRNKASLVEAADRLDPTGTSVFAVPCDIRDEQAVVEMVESTLDRFGGVDVLVNNGGIAGPTSSSWSVSLDEWRDTIETDLIGTFACCRAVLPAMLEQGSGSVILIGSMTGKRPLYGRTAYAAAKTALIGLTRTLALEAGPYGVRVNLISPGPLEGDRIQRVFEAQAANKNISVAEARQEMVRDSPLGRLVSPRDVADAVVFLAGDTATSITGEDINVSAGIVTY
jgi:NAD(P)-dependent dehydrogenase (short-subunit alcohol dehydrogenase family)